MKAGAIIKTSILALILGVIFFPTLVSMAGRFTAADSYYSHGFLIPPLSAFLIWRKRKALKALPIEPSPIGLWVLSGGLLLHVISSLLKLNFGSYLAIVIVLQGLGLYLFGKKINRLVLFPIALLLFMIPLPGVVIIGTSFRMKMFAARASTYLINLIGISAIRDGSILFLPNGGQLMIGDPCSGLRSLISLLALGALFTQFVNGSRLKKQALFLSSIPIALLSNMLRIIMLAWVTYVYGEQAAMGFFHDFSGLLVFVFAFLGLILSATILRCRLAPENI